jgi:hypothetical protein
MTLNHAANADGGDLGGPERYFSVESANEALVLVAPVVRDIVAAYHELMRLRAERQELALQTGSEDRLVDLRDRIERIVKRLQTLRRELADVGCEPKDLTDGLVDFPAIHEGRQVWLCWKLGEPEVAWWHGPDDGFAGRRPIDAEFRAGLRESQPTEIDQVRPD